jgi:ATP-dependent Lon protease
MMNYLDQKINEHFAGLVVRKDLVKAVKGNAIVPTYVLEYLLGQYCATSDEDSIQSGIESVREILRAHYVHRNEANLVKSTIREKGRHKVIDKVSVELNEKADVHEATFSNLGIKQVLIDDDTVRLHPKLLVSGVWCIADLEYRYSDDARIIPWVLDSLRPIQLSHFDFDQYLETRKQFTLEEWIDLLLQSMGFEPTQFDLRRKMMQLMRLVPYCERNYNLIELGPKGTGKSHIYSDFSPHGILISGGEVTVPKLFVNNSNGKIGLVGYWDTVAFDEFAGKKKRANKALVDILKNYMANKTFSRGIETLGAAASMVFVGNTAHELDYMLMHSDLFDELPPQYYDSAFLDRLHFYIPGWEVEVIRGEMFTQGYGFVVDYLAELLRKLRSYDYTQHYQEHFELSSEISTRDRDGVNKTFSGLMKILFPSGEAPQEDIEMILEFAIEGRKRVKDQLMRIDTTYPEVFFAYTDIADGTEKPVGTAEEKLYPQHYFNKSDNHTIKGKKERTPPPPPIVQELSDEKKLIQAGEGVKLEFKSTMRWNLQTDKADKAMEYSVLKTLIAFLNTEGGTLLIGVEDDGSVLGINADQFASEDKYSLHFANLVNGKIGKQFAGQIRWNLRELQNTKILRVDCSPSSVPVFLKAKDGEEFYVRSGPSSVRLSPSEVLAYSKKHFR